MTRKEIKELMLDGTLYTENYNTVCRVLHIFKHKSWIAYKGRIMSLKHKHINNYKHIKGDSTFNTNKLTKRLTIENSEEVLKELMKSYQNLL